MMADSLFFTRNVNDRFVSWCLERSEKTSAKKKGEVLSYPPRPSIILLLYYFLVIYSSRCEA